MDMPLWIWVEWCISDLGCEDLVVRLCHSLHFGHHEFCLLTGFKFGSISFCEYRNGDIPFRNRLFPEKIGYDVKIIDLFDLFDGEEKFSKLSDEDAIRLCLLLSLEVIFMGWGLVSVVDDVYLRMVNDLDAWNSFPWGENIWRQLYDSIINVSSKHKLEYLPGLKRNPNHVPSYSLTDMDNRVFLCIGSLVDQSAGNHTESIAPIKLAPTKDEVQCNWYAPSNDYFMWYVPRSPPVSIGGLYGEYLNKRSAACAAKKKSSEYFHPSECVREASLIDRSAFYPSHVVENQETLKKVVPQIEDYLQSTLEDEPDIKDHTSPKEDDGNVYCCDDNEDVPLFIMTAKPIIRLVDQRQHDHISNMAEVAEQKIQSEIQRSSHRSDEIWFDVYFDGRFFMCPLKYEDEIILDLRLLMSKRLSFKEMKDLLLDKTKEDIWKWFYCKPKCTLEEFCLVKYYFKNLDVVFESDEEVTSIYRGHEKAKNDANTMSFEEIVAWEKEELQSPSYLRSPHV
ncbi:phospholipase-like, aminotransferase-like mobile domain protein [Tanacetum coccineum]|uniref:Phospholipase-like, aminotransferase-like mobile domain protein n=1 Tax=Tanacetum coccineum TaxID=301880 RepID=A0ABQ4XXT9_9ASTR